MAEISWTIHSCCSIIPRILGALVARKCTETPVDRRSIDDDSVSRDGDDEGGGGGENEDKSDAGEGDDGDAGPPSDSRQDSVRGDGEDATSASSENDGESDSEASDCSKRTEDEESSAQWDILYRFVQYLLHLAIDPELEGISKRDNGYFDESVRAVEGRTMPGSIAQVVGNVVCIPVAPKIPNGEPTGHIRSSDTAPKIEQGKSEDYVLADYIKKTQCEKNNVLTRQIPYHPKTRIIIGTRCKERAGLFHTATHFQFEVFDEIKQLCKDHNLPEEPDNAYEYLRSHEELLQPLFVKFQRFAPQFGHLAKLGLELPQILMD
ncbi:hypothetical protein C8R43DRAFT_964540 [Mycena crocata]|nr:hypothetical protein C8R43DRAFT_964540 [Mycena crocata]